MNEMGHTGTKIVIVPGLHLLEYSYSSECYKLQNAKTLLLTHHTCFSGHSSPHTSWAAAWAMFNDSTALRLTLLLDWLLWM